MGAQAVAEALLRVGLVGLQARKVDTQTLARHQPFESDQAQDQHVVLRGTFKAECMKRSIPVSTILGRLHRAS